MSTWHVRAIERLGTPLPSWPTIWGPALPGADPIAANDLRTVDLTPFLHPLQDFSSTLERDLTKASFGSLALDLMDADESLAILLGPASATLATATRYYGPWIEVIERWGASEAVRWTGYLDEVSLQWDEASTLTRATVLHASQLLRERKLSDIPQVLRPYPSVPTTASQSFAQSTADALMDAGIPAYTPRANAIALEAALWAQGQLSWYVDTSRLVDRTWYGSRSVSETTDFPPPAPPSASLSIGGTTYHVDHIAWDDGVTMTTTSGTVGDQTTTATHKVVRIYLQGAPDLTGVLTLGATVTWGIAELLRTHYVLAENVPAPASGSDGQRWMKFTCVDQLVAGDVLTATYWDPSSGVMRRATTEVTVIDVDGEQGKVWLKEPLSQALGTSLVLKIRRNSTDPVLVDGVELAKAAAAPFVVDTTWLKPATTSLPVLTWQSHDQANPQLYGFHGLQTIDRAGGLQLPRRGALRTSDSSYPLSGVWEGSWSAGWSWLGSPTAPTPMNILGDLNQWPGGTNANRPPVLYVQGDLSGGATIPPNGWRGAFRTWKDPLVQAQELESWWDGAVVQWSTRAAVGLIPSKLVSFAAQTATPGRYIRTTAPAWTFEAHTAPGTLGAPSTPTITGTLPTGHWLALGMGIYAPAASDEQEALLGLVANGSTQPFTDVTAVVLSQAAGGDLTLRQSLQLWATGAESAGTWALGGGLVVQTVVETIEYTAYPKTILHKLDGTNHLTATFRTLEIIPQSIQPLSLSGAAGARTISGWYALALETALDENFVAVRRLRFLFLGPTLTLLNGEAEPDPTDPLNPYANFRRGDLVASFMPDGAVPCRLVRTGLGDAMAGFFGGRLFQIATEIPRTVERLAVEDLSVADYIERLAQALMASAIPDEAGNLRLVSRASGPLQVRTLEGQAVSVQAAERGPRKSLQTYRGYVSEVRVTYKDAITDESKEVVVTPGHEGGKPLAMDMSSIFGGITAARAFGQAAATWFGPPAGVISETWVDRTGGIAGDMAPPFWATWQVGDLVTFTPYDPLAPVPVDAYKLHQFKPGLEGRSLGVEFLALPGQILPGA